MQKQGRVYVDNIAGRLILLQGVVDSDDQWSNVFDAKTSPKNRSDLLSTASLLADVSITQISCCILLDDL